MTTQELADHLTSLTPPAAAAFIDEAFEIALNQTPIPEHDVYASELLNIGISIGHESGDVMASDGICKRKKEPAK